MKPLLVAFAILPSFLTVPRLVRAEDSAQVVVERKTKTISNGSGEKPFDVTRHTIPLSQIERNIPKDAIPALTSPQFVSAQEAVKGLKESDRVLGAAFDGEAKAYPIGILNRHELVNDFIGNRPVLVTWCPLCGSSVLYDPVVDGQRLTFGVTGLLYKRNAIFYDHETMSLWSQLLSESVAGPMAGTPLPVLPMTDTTWGEWRRVHPNTLVLSFPTGRARDYEVDPYESYPLDRKPALLVTNGVQSKIYSFSELKMAGPRIVDQVGGVEITIHYDHASKTAQVNQSNGAITSFVAFLNNLREFYPRAVIYKAPKR
ncbi:MAG: DUF3179 domain-containing protein [Acidobacteria bacterium]|nr:DUF3179 domain-containing protein [Acidobacteriota bacterium]